MVWLDMDTQELLEGQGLMAQNLCLVLSFISSSLNGKIFDPKSAGRGWRSKKPA